MHEHAVLLSIPGLRSRDLAAMPRLSSLAAGGGTVVPLTPSFPCVTCPVQANMTTGVLPDQHGVVANGFFWRDKSEVEMWTAWNDCLQATQIGYAQPNLTTSVWFPLHSKGAGADYICTPAPIHNPDGSESLWCFTHPTELYGQLRDALGHFPLMHFWGPLANIKSTDWIVDSAVIGVQKFRPGFNYIYLPHLDYAAQKFGPNSPQAAASLGELDAAIGRLIDGYAAARIGDVLWLAASEYAITEVDSVGYPNRVLRKAGLLTLQTDAEGREQLDVAASRAWALVDHQFAHVFVRDPADVPRVAAAFENDPTVERVLTGEAREMFHVKHSRSGEVVLIAQPRAWFAYYWWLDDAQAPAYARTVDIHRKPGYDPVELFIEMPARAIPLNASLVKGSHGHPSSPGCVLVTSDASAVARFGPNGLRDTDVAGVVLANFGAGPE
jgi:predicted AlkP superfamily pyrophosphatase or phosphodiesterase